MRYKITIEGFIKLHLFTELLDTATENYQLGDYFYALCPIDGFIDVGLSLFCESDELEEARSLAYLFDASRGAEITVEDLFPDASFWQKGLQ